ncbi:MBL fold metallo-hydrolase [Myxococcus sp. RHSTA-1-4]|uniref:MBL fold metallo-hydrolase n=1 Tax=Myxococcus sp. RHSTA-1-4 TaxID=2874601 RepID=UPI001CBC7B60|nr:MBL fold metallo-hydrolase [Myxococcus sp. RHSTA-1-4]MBZ4417995.1 MBL fold metallo-hydrolase [Myxococcus sp. RHSTA-1-4]
MRSLLAVLVAVPSVALAQLPDPAKAQVTSSPVAGNVHMLMGAGGNIGVSVGPDGLLIVDDQFEVLAPKINKALDKLSKAKISYVLNTHWHFDHTGGNGVFGREGRIVAHREVRTRLLVGADMGAFGVIPPAKKEALPVITYDTGMSLYFNGEEIRLTHLPAGHTDGDTLVHFTGSNVVHMGDHFFVDSFPFIDLKSGGSVEGYLRNIEQVLKTLPAGAKIIPGHGPLAGREELERFVATIRESVTLVRAKREAGKTLAQVKAEGMPEKFKPWGAGFINQDMWLETVFTSLEQSAAAAKARAVDTK